MQKVVALRVPDPDLPPLHPLIVVVKDLVAHSVSNLKKICPFLFFQVNGRRDIFKFLLEELLILDAIYEGLTLPIIYQLSL